MNGKKAKRLRREAQALTVEQPAARLVHDKRKGRHRTAVQSREATRGTYRELKYNARRGTPNVDEAEK